MCWLIHFSKQYTYFLSSKCVCFHFLHPADAKYLSIYLSIYLSLSLSLSLSHSLSIYLSIYLSICTREILHLHARSRRNYLKCMSINKTNESVPTSTAQTSLRKYADSSVQKSEARTKFKAASSNSTTCHQIDVHVCCNTRANAYSNNIV